MKQNKHGRGGHIRNKALKESRRGFTANFKSKQRSDMRNNRINRNNKMRPATGKMILSTVQNQTQEATQKRSGEAISSNSIQSETVCETNKQCQNTEQKKLEETIRLLTKKKSNKDKNLSNNEKTIERMAKREKEMEKCDSEYRARKRKK